MNMITYFTICFTVAVACGQDMPPVSQAEKKEIMALLMSENDRAGRDQLVLRGSRVLPVLYEVATSPKSGAFERARVFRVLWRMNVPEKDKFVAVAAGSLAHDSGRFSVAALALVAQSQDRRHARAVCDHLFRVFDIKNDFDWTGDIVKALVAVGTEVELKRLERWLRDNPTDKYTGLAGELFAKARINLVNAEKQLRAKLKK